MFIFRTRKKLADFDSTNPFLSTAQGLSEGFFKYVRDLIVQMNGSKNMTDLEKKIMEYGIADMAAFTVKRKEIAEWVTKQYSNCTIIRYE